LLNRLSVHRFRNLPDLTWEVGPGCHLILGRNGAGKTSLLEAVYLAATARSFRTAQLEDCVRLDPRPAGASADVGATSADESAAGSGFVTRAEVSGPPLAELVVSWGTEGLVRTLDGKAVPLAAYLGALPVVIWTSREDEILAGVPERRRRMIDAGLVAERPERVALLARHRRVLAQKRELLRRRQSGLEAWNRLLAEAGSALQQARAQWVASLAARLAAVLERAARPFPPIALRYEPSPPSGLDGTDALFESLAAAAADEIRLGRPCIGPHLDRLSMVWGATAEGIEGAPDVSRVASAGERKALGLLLVAAQAELLEAGGRTPTVLVDDVDAELDLEALEVAWRVLATGPSPVGVGGAGPSPVGAGGAGRQVLATSSRREIAPRLAGVAQWALDGGVGGLGPIRMRALDRS
jgi:DNA replication and repair protein RecF